MPLQTAEIIFNDSSAKSYKDLVDFLKRNLESIILKGQLKFRFKIIQTGELDSMRKKGVTSYPALVLIGGNQKPYMGTPTIIELLRQRVKRSKTMATPKSEEEVLDSYFKGEMHAKKGDDGKLIVPDDQEPSGQLDLTAALNREVDRRTNELSQFTGFKTDQVPSKPARSNTVDRDNDFEDRGMTQTHGQRPRQDNVQQKNEAGDPMAVFNNRRPAENGDAAEDDKLMQALLQRMGGGDF